MKSFAANEPRLIQPEVSKKNQWEGSEWKPCLDLWTTLRGRKHASLDTSERIAAYGRSRLTYLGGRCQVD